jgi:undecaprenyl-phosphate 4-deoxy-4-formamido-L-arabinose transferase
MVSVIIPCYCSENTIEQVVDDLIREFEVHNEKYQIVLVNDGSPDNTFSVIKKLSLNDSHITAVNLSKNYGQQAARLAAIPYADGEYVVCMDDDGQHPASGIFLMLDKLKEGDYDVVFAQFKKKKHNIIKKIGSWLHTEMLRFFAGQPKDVTNSAFVIMKKYVLKEMLKYKSPFPSWAGFLMQITRNISNIELEHQSRISGKSNYTLKKMLKLFMNGLTGFSVVPLRLSSVLGVSAALIGFCVGIYSIVNKILNPNVPIGYTSLISVILFVGGMIMMMLGILGEYVGRIYMINNNLPQYTVKEVVREQEERSN